MANKYFKVIIVFAFLLVSKTVLGQGPPPPPPPFTPVDGGIMALLALGIGYAIKNIYDNSKD